MTHDLASDRQTAFSGTREVVERLRFDLGRLESYLRDRIAGFTGPIAVSQFKGGQSNPTYLVATAAAALCAAPQAAGQSCCPPRMPSTANTG